MTAISPWSVPKIKRQINLSLQEMQEMFPKGVVIQNIQNGFLHITDYEGKGSLRVVDCRSILGTTSIAFDAIDRFTRQMAYFNGKRIIRLMGLYVHIKMRVCVLHAYC